MSSEYKRGLIWRSENAKSRLEGDGERGRRGGGGRVGEFDGRTRREVGGQREGEVRGLRAGGGGNGTNKRLVEHGNGNFCPQQWIMVVVLVLWKLKRKLHLPLYLLQHEPLSPNKRWLIGLELHVQQKSKTLV